MKFILPKSVKVGGVVYAIIEDPHLFKRISLSGQISYWPGEISVDAQTDQVAVLLHEVVHACWRHARGNDDQPENAVEQITETLRMLIADNPALFRHVADVLESNIKDGRQFDDAKG